MNFQNKKIYLIGLSIIAAGLVFAVSASFASAAGCEKNPAQSLFQTYANPLISFAEKTINGFGYNVALAAAPDPDFCGSDSVGCSGSTPTSTISWEAAPSSYSPDIYGSYYTLDHYILTVNGVGTYNTGLNTSYTVSSGLSLNTTYNWSVEAYYWSSTGTCAQWGWSQWEPVCVEWIQVETSSADIGYTNQPHGSFTTPSSCAPPPTITAQPQSQTINSGGTATLSVSATTSCVPSGFSYQWYQGLSGDTSNPISGATASSYTTPSLTVATNYWVKITDNCGGSVNSDTATVTITAAGFFLNSSNNIFVTLTKDQGKYSNATTLTVDPYSGFSSTVNLSVQSVSPSLPAGSSFSFTPSSLTSSQYTTGSQFKVYVGPGLTSSQQYTIIVQGKDGGLVRTAQVILNAQVVRPEWKEI